MYLYLKEMVALFINQNKRKMLMEVRLVSFNFFEQEQNILIFQLEVHA